MRIAFVVSGVVLAAAWAGLRAEAADASALASPAALTVEYMTDPVGLDAPAPRLSWKLAAARADAKNLRQGAYQVLVASTAEKLTRDEGDLWDSGRVASEQSLNIAYAGKPLATSQRCHWKVRAWEAGAPDAPSAWSAPARWIMGVVRPEDWKAKWIGANAATRPQADLAGAQWIWTGDAEGLDKAPVGKRYFRKVFDAPQNVADAPAMLAITADDQHEVYINGQLAAKTWGHLNDPRWIRFIDVSKFVKAGRNLIAVMVTNEKPGPTGLLALLTFAGGATVPTDASWTSSAKAPKDWKEAVDVAAVAGRKAAVAAGPADCKPWGRIERRVETVSPAFETTFDVAKPVREATLHITGLGFYEASLNGVRIGTKVLDPAPTRYDKRVLYSTYDVTARMRPGSHRLNVLLGHGWYDVRSVAVWNFDNAPWRDFPRMLAQLEIVYGDGTRETVVSDASWKQVASPIGFDCIREGEVIGKLPPGAPDLAASPLPVEVVPAPAGKLAASALPPAVIAREIKPIAVREVRPGAWTVDFGQNIAGWVRLAIRGQRAGDVVTIRYAEKLKPDGSLSL
ncbi:MAG: family 78 glycoside hydrolase catalytic domain, partial [Verrucomicrobia bacterium]|nr:family 78 glycoside hydrolase catalytic domain [Verrucomicrobiota bacterium]